MTIVILRQPPFRKFCGVDLNGKINVLQPDFNNSHIMKLNIAGAVTIAEIQKVFNDEYPYLKLVFFTRPHRAYKGSNAKFMIQERTCPLSELTALKREGELHLEAEMPVWQVERLFEEEFGLHVQVFRKSGSVWLETSVSDSLSLEQQNDKGHAAEQHITPIADPLDYREQD